MGRQQTDLEPIGSDGDDPLIRAGIEEALAASGRYGPAYEIVRQVSSGSRVNFVLSVVDRVAGGVAPLWCRATHAEIDDALGPKSTLEREALVLRTLLARSVRVPDIVAVSSSGRVLLQGFVEAASNREPNEAIAVYMNALDAVHALDPREVLPSSEKIASTTGEAVEAERAAWCTVAQRVLANRPAIETLERTSGLVDLAIRLRNVHDFVSQTQPEVVSARPDLVHGDAGRANYVIDTSGSVWLLDWELAHAGSRLEDYAWIELRGLEEDTEVWRREVLARLRALGPVACASYAYFRSTIYFRSVLAIAARICAKPDHPFVPYLVRRFRENEWLGWRSAGAAPPEALLAGPRLTAWHKWTEALETLTGDR